MCRKDECVCVCALKSIGVRMCVIVEYSYDSSNPRTAGNANTLLAATRTGDGVKLEFMVVMCFNEEDRRHVTCKQRRII